MNRTVLAALALLAAAGVGAYALLGSDDPATETAAQAPASAATGVPTPVILRGTPSEPLPARDWALGVRRRYKVETERAVSLAFGQGQAAAGTQILGGTLELTPIANEGEAVFVHGRLADPRFAISGDDEGVPQLDSEFLINYRRDGTLDSILYPKGLHADTKNELSWLVAALQQVAPADPMAGSWTTREPDQTGLYEARYQRGANAPNTVVKHKLRYIEISDPETGAGPDDYAIEAEQVTDIGNDGWPKTLRADESDRVEASDVVLAIDARITAALLDSGDGNDIVARADELFANMVADELAAEVGLGDLREDLDRQMTGGRSVADLLAAIRDADSEARNHLLFATAAALRLDPEGVAGVESAIRGEDPGEAANIMLGALGASGLDAAQDALGDLLTDDDVAPEHRLSATASLAQSASHTPESIEDLRQAADGEPSNVQRAATLALGAAARANEGGEALVAELLEKLAAATTTEERILLLGALGNTGHIDALPALSAAAADANARIRKEAVEALRFIADDRVDVLIGQALTGDPDSSVRGAALFAVAFRSLAVHLTGLSQVAQSEPDAGVRRALVTLLASQVADPGAMQILSYMAANDDDADVRAAAAAAVAEANNGQ